jgi:hypothetical protein
MTENIVVRAMRLWPNDYYLQCEWLRAVKLVRETKIGWLLDHPPRHTAPGIDRTDNFRDNVIDIDTGLEHAS